MHYKHLRLRHLPAALILSLVVMATLMIGAGFFLIASPQNSPGRQLTDHELLSEFQKNSQRLREAIDLQPSQESAWNDFLQAVRPLTSQELGPKPDFLYNTPANSEKIWEYRQKTQKYLAKRDSATRAFYKELGNYQQQIFDEMFIKSLRPPLAPLISRRSP